MPSSAFTAQAAYVCSELAIEVQPTNSLEGFLEQVSMRI
ncbi:MAG: hypothetical protein ACI841_000996, partial [Planctomycetota bacterium]